jgi:hypothetical protein
MPEQKTIHPAGPDRRALVMAVFPAKIEAGHRGRDDLTHATSRRWTYRRALCR